MSIGKVTFGPYLFLVTLWYNANGDDMRLKDLRKGLNLTQQQVADAINIDRALYVRYENGTRTPPIQNLVILADFFHVSLDYLVGRSDDPMYEHKWTSEDGAQNVLLSTEKDPPAPSRRRELEKQADEADTNEIVISKKDIPKNRKELEQFVLEILRKEQGKN